MRTIRSIAKTVIYTFITLIVMLALAAATISILGIQLIFRM